MRKVAIAFLQRSSPSHTSIGNRSRAFFLPSRHLATPAVAPTHDAGVVALSETSVGASEIRKALQQKKGPRPKTNKSGCSDQVLRSAEGSFHTEISTKKTKTRAKRNVTADACAKDLVRVVATEKRASSVRVVATKRAAEPAEGRVIVEAENVTVCENVQVGKREKLASCAELGESWVAVEAENVIACENAQVEHASCGKASANIQEGLAESIAKLELSTYKYADRWKLAARKLLDYGIPHAEVIIMLRKCRYLPCSTLWVDSTLKHFAQLGMSQQEMGKVISKWPTILNVTDSMFQRKIEFFESIGIEKHFLGKTVASTVQAITKPLSVLRKNAAFWNDYLKDVSPNAVGSMMLKNPSILTYISYDQKLLWLETQDFHKKWLLKFSKILSLPLPVLVSKAEMLERLGILDVKKRFGALVSVYSNRTPKLLARVDNLLTAGFSRYQAEHIITNTPTVLTCTEDYVNAKVDYVLNVMNGSLEMLASSRAVWSCSLERRIKYRYEVIKKLQSLGVLRHKLSLNYMVRMTNVDFNRKFVEKLRDVAEQADTLS